MSAPAAWLLLAALVGGTPEESTPAMENATKPTASVAPEGASTVDESLDGFDEVEYGRAYVADSIIDSARWVDSFFVSERALAEENLSSWSISGNASVEEGRGVEGAIGNDLRILLPTLEKQAQIMFTSLSDNDPALNTRRRDGPGQSPDPSGQRQKNFTAGVGVFIDNVKERSVRVDAGAAFVGVTPKVYTGLRFRVSAEWGPWETSFTQRFSWYQDTAWEGHTYVDVYRDRPGEDLLHFGSEISWYNGKVGIYYGQIIGFTTIIDNHSAVTQEFFSWFSSDPYDKLDDVGVQTVYRRKLIGEWFWGELSTWVRFPRDRGFERTLGAMAKFQVTFGPKEESPETTTPPPAPER